MGQCHYCRVTLSAEVQRKNRLCPQCGSDLHCCKNCVHYDESFSSKCREPNSPWIGDRSSQNLCPFFEFSKVAHLPPGQPAEILSEAERAKEAFRALFRDL